MFDIPFDTMTTQRVYNKAKTIEEVMNELQDAARCKINTDKGVSQQLDPLLVEKFICVLKQNN